MKRYYHIKDSVRCEIIFVEAGRASVRCANGEVRHGVPLNYLRTEEEQAAWLLIHPKNKPYMHEVLEVIDAAKRMPRAVDEADEPWLAHLRQHAVISANLKYETVEKFLEQYEAASGIQLSRTSPGVYVNHEGNGKWKNSLLMHFKGELPAGCPEQPKPCGPNEFSINNTRFLWSLIAREGFRIGL